MQRYSKQREVILSNLRGRYDHPTAEMVYRDVRETIPNISLGTVYRNLSNLSTENVILCFTINGKDHFDGHVAAHLHLYCDKCGSIEDREIRTESIIDLAGEFSEISNVIIYGKCKKCKNNIKEEI